MNSFSGELNMGKYVLLFESGNYIILDNEVKLIEYLHGMVVQGVREEVKIVKCDAIVDFTRKVEKALDIALTIAEGTVNEKTAKFITELLFEVGG